MCGVMITSRERPKGGVRRKWLRGNDVERRATNVAVAQSAYQGFLIEQRPPPQVDQQDALLRGVEHVGANQLIRRRPFREPTNHDVGRRDLVWKIAQGSKAPDLGIATRGFASVARHTGAQVRQLRNYGSCERPVPKDMRLHVPDETRRRPHVDVPDPTAALLSYAEFGKASFQC